MPGLLDQLDFIWRIGVLTYAGRGVELCVNGAYSLAGRRHTQLGSVDESSWEGHGRLCIVTGSSAGVGMATAGQLHRKGEQPAWTPHLHACN